MQIDLWFMTKMSTLELVSPNNVPLTWPQTDIIDVRSIRRLYGCVGCTAACIPDLQVSKHVMKHHQYNVCDVVVL